MKQRETDCMSDRVYVHMSERLQRYKVYEGECLNVTVKSVNAVGSKSLQSPLRVGPNNTLEQYIIDDTVQPLVPYCLNIVLCITNVT